MDIKNAPCKRGVFCVNNSQVFPTILVDKKLAMGYNIFNLKCVECFYNFEPTFTFMGVLYCSLDVKPPFAVEGRRAVAVAHLATARRQK